MKILYNSLEKKLGINFKDKDLLVKSLTHKSFDNQHNNEKIEFLGDRVLGLVIAKKLLEIYPNEKEGILDKKFASLVNRKTCLQIANELFLSCDFLIQNSMIISKFSYQIGDFRCNSFSAGFSFNKVIIKRP